MDGIPHDKCNYLGAAIEGSNMWFCNKCGHSGLIYIWVVIVEWGPGSCDPMVYVRSAWTEEEPANKDAEAYGPQARVVKIRANKSYGIEL